MKKLFIQIKDLMRHSHASKTSIFSLIIINLFTIIFAVCFNWKVEEVIMLFWAQNIIIGIVAVLKLFIAKNIIFVKSDEFISNKKTSIIIFGIKFFVFNLFYLLFFKDFMNIGETLFLVLIPLIALFLNHILSFFINYKKDFLTPIYYKKFTNFVFMRVLPIHIFIIFGSWLIIGSFVVVELINLVVGYNLVSENIVYVVTLVFFMFLKSFFEIIAHIISHTDNNYLEKIDAKN